MAFFDNLKSGVSSDSGLTQGADQGGFRLLPNSGGSGSSTGTAPFNDDFVRQAVEDQLQRNQQGALQDISRNTSLSVPQPGANPYGVPRSPWIFATFDGLTAAQSADALKANQGLPANTVVWYANPKSVDWTINQRGMEAKTKSGTVLHIWRDRLRKTDYDDPKITMTFQSGSILPGFSNGLNPSTMAGRPDLSLSPGLNNFYQFLQLVDASKIKNGQANLIHILYRSRIFPSMVMAGFFDPQSVVKFTDSTDNPFQINSWSATFTIYKTIPRYNNWAELSQQFQAEFGGDPYNTQIIQPGAPRPDATATLVGNPKANTVTPGFDPNQA